MIYAWIARHLPRRLVLACLLRTVKHADKSNTIVPPQRKYGKEVLKFIAFYGVEHLIQEWRDVCDGEHKELR